MSEMEPLPTRVVVDAHGHFWRDYGTFWSMCPVSDENHSTAPVAIYVRAKWSEAMQAEATLDAARAAAPVDPILEGLQRNDMGRVLALALSSQGYAQTNSEAVGLALLREIEEQGYTLRLTTHAERRERNDRGQSS